MCIRDRYDIRAIIISNTTDKNRENLINTSKHQKGGLSGKPLEAKSNKLIYNFYSLLKGKIEIIIALISFSKSVSEINSI